MNTSLFLGLFSLIGMFSSPIFAQSRKTYKVNPGEKILEALPKEAVYLLPKFTQGLVQFKNGAVGGAKMNYNHLLGAVEFINEQKDTLELNNNPPIKYVVLTKDTLYFDKKWMYQKYANGNIIVAKSAKLEMVNRQRKGVYGVISEGSVNPVTQLSFNGRSMRDLTTNEILTFAFHDELYFGDKFGVFKPANKKGLLALFGKKKQEIETYLNEQPVNFNDEADVIRLATYIQKIY